jgi:hypothetical protein
MGQYYLVDSLIKVHTKMALRRAVHSLPDDQHARSWPQTCLLVLLAKVMAVRVAAVRQDGRDNADNDVTLYRGFG